MKFTLGLIIGAAATAIVVHYINSIEGQLLINRVKNDADELGDNLEALKEGLVEKGKSFLGKGPETQQAEIVIVV